MSGPSPLSRRHTNPGRVSKKQRTLVRPKAKKQYPFAAALRGGSYATGLLLNVLNFRLHKTNSSSVWKLMLQMYGICSRLPNISAVFSIPFIKRAFHTDEVTQQECLARCETRTREGGEVSAFTPLLSCKFVFANAAAVSTTIVTKPQTYQPNIKVMFNQVNQH